DGGLAFPESRKLIEEAPARAEGGERSQHSLRRGRKSGHFRTPPPVPRTPQETDMECDRERFVPKVHPATREVLPEDPLALHATPVEGDPDVLIRALVREYAWMG